MLNNNTNKDNNDSNNLSELHDKFTNSSSKGVIEVVHENVYRVHLRMLFQMDLKTKSGLLKMKVRVQFLVLFVM